MKSTGDGLDLKYVIFESFANVLIIRKFFFIDILLRPKTTQKGRFCGGKSYLSALRNEPYCNAKRTVLQFESVFTAFLSDIFRLADSISLIFGDVKIGKKYLLSYILLPSRQRTDEGRQLVGHLLLLAVAGVVACAIAEVAGLGREVEAIDILVAVLATFLL